MNTEQLIKELEELKNKIDAYYAKQIEEYDKDGKQPNARFFQHLNQLEAEGIEQESHIDDVIDWIKFFEGGEK